MAEQTSARFAEYLRRSLELLREHSPLHFHEARRALNGKSATIQIDGESALTVSLETAPWLSARTDGEVRLSLGSPDLLKLLSGLTTIEQAIAEDRLRIRGRVEHLTDFLTALNAWLHGALRCPSLARLHRAYLDGHVAPSRALN